MKRTVGFVLTGAILGFVINVAVGFVLSLFLHKFAWADVVLFALMGFNAGLSLCILYIDSYYLTEFLTMARVRVWTAIIFLIPAIMGTGIRIFTRPVEATRILVPIVRHETSLVNAEFINVSTLSPPWSDIVPQGQRFASYIVAGVTIQLMVLVILVVLLASLLAGLIWYVGMCLVFTNKLPFSNALVAIHKHYNEITLTYKKMVHEAKEMKRENYYCVTLAKEILERMDESKTNLYVSVRRFLSMGSRNSLDVYKVMLDDYEQDAKKMAESFCAARKKFSLLAYKLIKAGNQPNVSVDIRTGENVELDTLLTELDKEIDKLYEELPTGDEELMAKYDSY